MSPNHDGLPNSAEPASTNAGDTAANLLTIMRELLLEIRQSERDAPTLTLDSHIDRDLALDSLARTELLQRIERNFRVQLDEKVLLAESPRDLLELILRASGQPPEQPRSRQTGKRRRRNKPQPLASRTAPKP